VPDCLKIVCSGGALIAAQFATICLFQLLVMSGASQAQGQGPWWTWPTIDGNWFGYRHALADHGLAFSGTTVVDLQGNSSGGQSRGFATADGSLLALDTDLGNLAGIKGLLLHAEFVANAGPNLSARNIGNVLQAATAFAQPGYYLGQMYAQQKLFNDKFSLQVGRMTTANNFASLPVFADYVSFADNPIPISLTNNSIYFTSLPSVEWATVGTLASTLDVDCCWYLRYESRVRTPLRFATWTGFLV